MRPSIGLAYILANDGLVLGVDLGLVHGNDEILAGFGDGAQLDVHSVYSVGGLRLKEGLNVGFRQLWSMPDCPEIHAPSAIRDKRAHVAARSIRAS